MANHYIYALNVIINLYKALYIYKLYKLKCTLVILINLFFITYQHS